MEPSVPSSPRLVVMRPWMLLVLLTLPVAMTVILVRLMPGRRTAPEATPAATAAREPARAAPSGERIGPWGNLTVTPVTIQPPVRLIPPALYSPKALYWEVGTADEPAFRRLLTDAGVDAKFHDVLINELRTQPDNGRPGVLLEPSFVRGLPADVRGRLYRALLRLDSRNREQFGLMRWSTERWAQLRADLPAAVGDLVAEFTFPATTGTDVHFWDLPTALHFLPDESDRIALTRAVNSQRTFLLSLNVGPDSPVPQIAEYWRLSRTRRQIMPMLESLAAGPGTNHIDALHLMPPFVREHAYTYPVSTLGSGTGMSTDCFWTCANFDRRSDELTIPLREAAAYLTSHYVTYVGRPEFGDIIVLQDTEGNAIHAAVHIADNIVFTKNGGHPLMPWVFMERDEMIRIYELADPAKTIWVRRATD